MKPIGKYVVIKTIEEELKTSSGLLLSAEDANQLRYKKGKIVAVGTDVVAIDKVHGDCHLQVWLPMRGAGEPVSFFCCIWIREIHGLLFTTTPPPPKASFEHKPQHTHTYI